MDITVMTGPAGLVSADTALPIARVVLVAVALVLQRVLQGRGLWPIRNSHVAGISRWTSTSSYARLRAKEEAR